MGDFLSTLERRLKFITLNPTSVGDKDRTSRGRVEEFTPTLEGKEGVGVHLNGHWQFPRPELIGGTQDSYYPNQLP